MPASASIHLSHALGQDLIHGALLTEKPTQAVAKPETHDGSDPGPGNPAGGYPAGSQIRIVDGPDSAQER